MASAWRSFMMPITRSTKLPRIAIRLSSIVPFSLVFSTHLFQAGLYHGDIDLTQQRISALVHAGTP